MDLLILCLLIGLNGLFALAEMSIVSSKKNRLSMLAESGDSGAKAAMELADDPNRILATTQLGLTFVTLIEGSFGAHSFAGPLEAAMPHWEWIGAWRGTAAQALVLAAITFATLIFGEMLPKRAALVNPEAIARRLAPLAKKFIGTFSPLIRLLSWSTDKAMGALGLPMARSEEVLAEDVETMLEAAGHSGLLSENEMKLMDNVWRLDERKVGAVMTPRQNIHFIDIEAPSSANMDSLAEHPSSRHVVAQGGLDHVLGFGPTKLWIASMLRQLREGVPDPKIDWTESLSPALTIPNTLSLIEALEAFKAHKTHAALVYNEFGQLEGLLSISDLLDALVGEVAASAEQKSLIHKDKSGKWLIDGLASISDTKSALELFELPGEAEANYQTAGGFALWMVGRALKRLPQEFDQFEHAGYRFQIVDIDRSVGQRVDKIMVEKL